VNRASYMQQNRRSQSGIGMIEVLITLLVISFGFLGIAALQARALSTNNSSAARTMATISTYSILDAMRADILNAKNGLYNGTVAADNCPAAGASLPSAQIYTWCEQLGQSLSATASTTGVINCTTTGDCTITIQFDDSRAGTDAGSSASQQVITMAEL
jgi:type IV pilus assembly protein PilV